MWYVALNIYDQPRTTHRHFLLFSFTFLKILSLGSAFDKSATVMALEGVQKKAEVVDNCENCVCSLTVHKRF